MDISVGAMYDAEARGSRLLDSSRLSPQDQRLVLVGSRYSLTFEDISESLVMQFPDFKPPPPVMGKDGQMIARAKGTGKFGSQNPQATTQSQSHGNGKGAGKFGPRKVFVTEAGAETENQVPDEGGSDDLDDNQAAEDDQNQDGPGDEADDHDQGDDLDDFVQVLTVTARRLASVRLGRKFSGNKVPPSELKKKTACAACGEIGHWRGDPQCKVSGTGAPASSSSSNPGPSTSALAKKGGKGAKTDRPHQAFTVMRSDLGNYEVRSGYGTAFSAEQPQGHYQVNVVFATQDVMHSSGFVGYMVLDTACQRTCCGRRWLHEHCSLLQVYDLETIKVDCRDRFQFGKGDPIPADHRAYVLAVLDDGSPFVFGAGVLDAGIPLLASNPLLKALGMVLDLPRMVVYFERLSAEVPVVSLNGRLAVNISAFSVGAVASLKQFIETVDWQIAAPELPFDQASLTISPGHAPDSTTMVAKVALSDAEPPLLPQEPVPADVPSSPSQDVGSSLAGGGDPASLGCPLHESRGVRPRRHLPVRQCDRQIRQVPQVHDKMGVEERRRKVGTAPLQRVFALIGAAIALLGQYGLNGGTDYESFSPGGGGKDDTFLGAAVPEYDLSSYPPNLRLEDFGARRRRRNWTPGASDRGWRGDHLRLGRVKGFKRLAGNIGRASRILDGEVKVYNALPTVASWPPGCVDLLELFAGEADRVRPRPVMGSMLANQLTSPLAGTWTHNGIKTWSDPWSDGFDLGSSLSATLALTTASFNENLDYSHRHLELQARRDRDQPRRQFLADLCREQAEQGRHFFIENPQRSRLWEQDEFIKLSNLPGTTMGHAHLGAFGSETVVKPNLWSNPSACSPICRDLLKGFL